MRKIKKPHLIIFSIYTAIALVGAFFVFWVSENYGFAYGTPENANGVADFSGYSIPDGKQLNVNLCGEWEFFYNRWIITDNDTGAPDGMITLPGRWTGKTYNGQKLPKTGYASYRMTVQNYNEIKDMHFSIGICRVAYRTYINGVLSTYSGVTSKSSANAHAAGLWIMPEYYGHNGEDPLTLVIEIAYNSQGGLLAQPWVGYTETREVWFWYTTFPLFLIGGMCVAFLFCAFMPMRAMKRNNRLSLVALVFTLLLTYLTTVDGSIFTVDLLGVNGALIPLFSYMAWVLFAGAHIYNMLSHKIISLNKREAVVLAAVTAGAAIAFFALTGTAFQVIPIVINILTLLWVSFKILKGKASLGYFTSFLNIHYFLTFGLFISLFGEQGLLNYGVDVFFSVGLLAILMGVIFINFFKARDVEVMALKAAQSETEIAVMKNQTLKSQIKPHFIFNSLSAIQDIYRRSPAEGEEMLSRFAAHLRANVDSDNKDLVPFKSELKNILNYFELENLRHEKKLTLILNAEYTEFYVPVLSLQPFLENAVKYADTQSMENGHIQISSSLKEDGCVVVEVSDNGAGFDTGSIRKDAVGIKNATGRLKYGINASVSVKSEPGKGTAVTIIIPAAAGKEKA